MKDGFITLSAAIPKVTVASAEENKKEIISIIEKAGKSGISVLLFPELSLTAATAGDLFFSDRLLREAEGALFEIAKSTRGLGLVAFVGTPLRVKEKLYDCSVAIFDGELIGAVPKAVISSVSDIDEARYFSAGKWEAEEITLMGKKIPFGAGLIFAHPEKREIKLACSVGFSAEVNRELSAAGATVILSPAAFCESVGRGDVLRAEMKAGSHENRAVYVFANAGEGESTTDSVFSGRSFIAAGGKISAERLPFEEKKLIFATSDISHVAYDRMREKKTSFSPVRETFEVKLSLPIVEAEIKYAVSRTPFVPTCDCERRERAAEILEIQARGLAKRISASRSSGTVVALSGGLDSTLAILAAARATDIAGLPRESILSVTMPCFGTTVRTRSNAETLASELGTSFCCIDIKEAVDLHFRDIGHDSSDLSVVYENSQARERTQIIMDIANSKNALVVGTGDLSELALGWATYNGDHMSNYGVNAGIPKTLIRHVVSCYADVCESEEKTALASVLRDILDTPVSPELLPAKDGEIAQKTEDIVGPYELHDFFLYHYVRYGEGEGKIFREALAAFDGVYPRETVAKWLKIFLRRFTVQKFKRSALPDGVRIGSVALSPRGAWKMPSDAAVANVDFE